MVGVAQITAEAAGKALRVIGQKLHDAHIVTDEGRQVLTEESFRMTKLRDQTSWITEIPRGRPVSFERINDRNGDAVNIALSAERIAIDQGDEDGPAFASLDVAIALSDLAGEPLCRWHLDRANAGQSGPLFHLQMGGHLPGLRDRELPIAEPRWCHPPLELGLLCEVIAANFFVTSWSATLRADPGWCHAIRTLQQLCYPAYVRRLTNCLAVSDSTALAQMWNGHWT